MVILGFIFFWAPLNAIWGYEFIRISATEVAAPKVLIMVIEMPFLKKY
jgi:hypothetical protein